MTESLLVIGAMVSGDVFLAGIGFFELREDIHHQYLTLLLAYSEIVNSIFCRKFSPGLNRLQGISQCQVDLSRSLSDVLLLTAETT